MEEISVSLNMPNPKQPRTAFDEDALEELADSIKTLGLIQPITVRKESDTRYIIISGERRWRAFQAGPASKRYRYLSAKRTTARSMKWPSWRTYNGKT